MDNQKPAAFESRSSDAESQTHDLRTQPAIARFLQRSPSIGPAGYLLSVRHNRRDRNIPGIGRQSGARWQQLRRKADATRFGTQPRRSQKAIIKPSSSAQSIAEAIKPQARHQDQLDFAHVCDRQPLAWLSDAELCPYKVRRPVADPRGNEHLGYPVHVRHAKTLAGSDRCCNQQSEVHLWKTDVTRSRGNDRAVQRGWRSDVSMTVNRGHSRSNRGKDHHRLGNLE